MNQAFVKTDTILDKILARKVEEVAEAKPGSGAWLAESRFDLNTTSP